MGGTTVEHGITRSTDPARAEDYGNCLYACRFCNRSRSATPHLRGGVRLLDPTRDAWARHFVAVDDRLEPRDGDAAAEHTHGTYDLDDARKVARRQARRALLTDRLALPGRLEAELVEILRLADRLRRSDMRRFASILRQISAIRSDARRALSDIKRYEAIPGDAPRSCRCAEPANLSVPRELGRQWLDVPDSIF